MEKNKFKITRDYICYSLIIFLLLITFLALATYMQIKEYNAKKSEITQNEKNIICMSENIIVNNVDEMVSDINYLEYTLHNYDEAAGYRQLEENWKTFLDSKKIYYQIGYIDVNGSEKIRINYKLEGSYTSENEELLNKADKYYFLNTIGLSEHQIYVSKLDLNDEDHEIQMQPVIRLSMAVSDNDGRIKGIVVLSYNASYLLEDFKNASAASAGNIYLLNNDGYWLFNETSKDKEWTFMYDDKNSVSFKNEFPDEWEEMNNNIEGTIITDDGLYSYKKITPFAGYNSANMNEIKLISFETNWLIVTFIPNDSENGIIFNDKLFDIFLFTLQKKIPILVIVFLISIILLMLITAKRRSKMKFSTETMKGIHDRRTGFKLLKKLYHNAKNQGKALSFCIIDVDGYKKVNNTYGQEVGDELIISIIDGIKTHVRKSDLIFRTRDDEFLIAFINVNMKKAEEIWQRINQEYQLYNETGIKKISISVSYGIGEFAFTFNENIYDVIILAVERMNEEKDLRKTSQLTM